jgi:hypothetical protein
VKESPGERIVEHIRKNFSLFETNRETYNLSPAYTNRGHLQSLLVQKQNQTSDSNPPEFRQQPFTVKSTRLNDQYTQYRASDLIGIQDHRENPIERQARITLDKQPGDQQNRRRQTAAGEKKSNSLKRSVSSLNGLIKRQVEFVKSKGGRHPQVNPKQVVEQDNEIRATGEQQYKVPSKQTFVGTSSLYLLPAPDHKVHIATLVVKDIILAHLRAKQKQAVRNAHRRSNKPTSK